MASPQGRVSTDAEYHNLTAIRSPDRPVRSKSLYRLSCPGPLNKYINKKDVWLYNDAVLLMDPNSIFPPCSLLLQTHSVQKYDSADVSRINIKIRNLSETYVNPLNPEVNPICYLPALLGAHHFLHVSRIRVKLLTFRLLMSYIHMEHQFLMFLDHTQRRSTVGRTPLDE